MYPVTNEIWGDRGGSIIDPFGFKWYIATHVREVSKEELEKAMPQMMENMMKSVQQGGSELEYYKHQYLTLKRKLSLQK